jgi:ubiquitin carboxyl-terminal hydrolase 25/28
MQEDDQLELTELLRNTKNVLEGVAEIESDGSLEISPKLLNELDQLCQSVQAELHCKNSSIDQSSSFQHTNFYFAAVDQEIQSIQASLSNQFSRFGKVPYLLYAVFMHHGSVSFGHYWIYIRDFVKGIWRKYNDEYVTEVQNLDEIFKNNDTKNPPTPYFLVYIHDDMWSRLVDPVCRDIPEWQTDASTEDTEATTAMEDVQSPGITVSIGPPAYEEATSMDHVVSIESTWPTAAEEKQAFVDATKKDDAY